MIKLLEKSKDNEEINQQSHLRERIFINFILEIAEFLGRKEKIGLRGISKDFNERILSGMPINFNLKKKQENKEFNEKNFELIRILANYKNIERINIENLSIEKDTLKLFQMLVENNKSKLKRITMGNLCYVTTQFIAQFLDVLNNISSINEFSIVNDGNKDRLFIHLFVNRKDLNFGKEIRRLKIENIMESQIPIILKYFPSVDDLTIENSSIGDNLESIANAIDLIYKDNQLKSLNLSRNKLSSYLVLRSLKFILKRQKNLKKLILKDLWVGSLMELADEFKAMHSLIDLDVTGSKYAFTNDFSFKFFNSLQTLQNLNLSDCGIKPGEFFTLLENLGGSLIDFNISRNLLNDYCIDLIISNKDKFNNLKILNLSSNPKVTNKGVNFLLKNLIASCLKNLKSVDLKNCGINLKLSNDQLVEFIYQKPPNFECFELYFFILSDDDYLNFLKNVYNKSFELFKTEDTQMIRQIRLKIFIKIKKPLNVQVSKKACEYADALYRRHNMVIR